ncbi:MAG: FAD:protein FMN transferase [Sedimentisphaerales bacterium]|nr:FAD:protein FMN transferase [Sedimentisphaerales bacterium]
MKDFKNQYSPVGSEAKILSGAHRFSHEAMAAVFEVYVVCDNATYARQAAQAAFEELDHLEQDFSRFIANSDISRLNCLTAGGELALGLDTFECLSVAQKLWKQTKGAFDVTVGALYQCWLNEDKTIRQPSPENLALAIEKTGMDKLILNSHWYTAKVTIEGIQFDLGGIGKGYGVDRIAHVFEEWKLRRVLIHGGGSSLLAMEGPSEGKGWPVTFSNPLDRSEKLIHLELTHRAVGSSGLEQGKHIIDPRPGKARPVEGKLASWSLAPNATTADALSTAFMVMGDNEIEQFCKAHSDSAAMTTRQVKKVDFKLDIRRWGDWSNATILR